MGIIQTNKTTQKQKKQKQKKQNKNKTKTEISAAEITYGETLIKAQRFMTNPDGSDVGLDFGGTVGESLHDFSESAKHIGHIHVKFGTNIMASYVKRLTDLRKDLHKESISIKQDVDKLQLKIKNFREESNTFLNNHERNYK